MQPRNVLVTGGAGYIGSLVVKALKEANAAHISVVDNLSTGFLESLSSDIHFIQGDIRDFSLLSNILHSDKIDTVIHLAAVTVIPESLQNPMKYYENNTLGTLNLLNACLKHDVEYFIYSSTAAVYGYQKMAKINEDSATSPANPYGRSKLISEQILKDVGSASGLKYAILRYFNVAGACPSGTIGQRTLNATHLIKVAVQAACGLTRCLPIYGTHYPTRDGTCIRDFIHVCDLATIHIQALHYLQEGGEPTIFNCGYGHGFSVKEVIQAIESITAQPLPILDAPAREGDLPCVIADNTKIKNRLPWHPQFDNLAMIVKTAYDFEKNLHRKLMCEDYTLSTSSGE